MSKVSILVPVYGVEKFIERCAISLFEQTFDDIEYIFVNDCSPDNSIEKLKNVIEKYPQRKSQIKIINHTYNKGLAGARNTGVENATGEYILHIDSDDYIESNMVQRMYEKGISENADIIACDFMLVWASDKKIAKQNIGVNKTDFIQLMLSATTMVGLVNKMIKRSLYTENNISSFEGINLGEDFVTTPRLAYYADKIVKIDEPFYNYLQTNTNSYTNNYSKKNIDNVIFVLDELTAFFSSKKDYTLYKEYLLRGKLKKKIELIFTADKKYFTYLENIFPEVYELENLNFLSRREKLILFFLKNKQLFLLMLYQRIYKALFKIVQKSKGR